MPSAVAYLGVILSDFQLSTSLRNVLAKLAPIVCSEDVENLQLTEAVVDDTELFFRSLAPGARSAIVAGLVSFDLSAALNPKNMGRRFARLNAERSLAHFESWWHSPIPLMQAFAKGIKGALNISFYENPVVKKHLKYNPEEWISQVKQARMNRWGDELQRYEKEQLKPDPLH
ncbi:MAG: hypothetical protein V1754_07325 [Pseudomonadota bacterium]